MLPKSSPRRFSLLCDVTDVSSDKYANNKLKSIKQMAQPVVIRRNTGVPPLAPNTVLPPPPNAAPKPPALPGCKSTVTIKNTQTIENKT